MVHTWWKRNGILPARFFLVQNKSFFKCFNILSVGGSDAYLCLMEKIACLQKNLLADWVAAGKASSHSGKTEKPWLFFFLSFFCLSLGGSTSATFLESWGFPSFRPEDLGALPVRRESATLIAQRQSGHPGLGVAGRKWAGSGARPSGQWGAPVRVTF